MLAAINGRCSWEGAYYARGGLEGFSLGLRSRPDPALGWPGSAIAIRSALLPGYGRGEIGILVRHPIDEFTHGRIGQQAFDIHPMAL